MDFFEKIKSLKSSEWGVYSVESSEFTGIFSSAVTGTSDSSVFSGFSVWSTVSSVWSTVSSGFSVDSAIVNKEQSNGW